ncbi:TPA: hypothetical protein ACVO34_003246 [Vibrio diabolicus]
MFGSLLIFRRDLEMLSQWNTLPNPVVHNAALRGDNAVPKLLYTTLIT